MYSQDFYRTQIRDIGRAVARHATQRAADREALRINPMVPAANVFLVLAEHDRQTADARRPLIERGRALAQAYADAYGNFVPDFRPRDAAHASWIAAIATQAPSFSPRVLSQTMRDAAARGDTALCAALLPLAASYDEYKKEFSGGRLFDAIAEAQSALDGVPDAVAAREAKEFADTAAQEFVYLDTILAGSAPGDALAVHVSTGSFPTLAITDV